MKRFPFDIAGVSPRKWRMRQLLVASTACLILFGLAVAPVSAQLDSRFGRYDHAPFSGKADSSKPASSKKTNDSSTPLSTQRLRHFTDALLLLHGVQPADMSYRHENNVVRWKGAGGARKYESHADCSGFINALLKHSYGFTDNDFKKWFGSKRPTARRYYEQIVQQNRFQRITTLSDIRAGDLLAVKYPVEHSDTGHVMLVAAPARRLPAPKLQGPWTQRWEVEVIDQSSSGHGPTDTRRKADGSSRPGLGRGILRVDTNSSGNIVGYAWSTLANSTFYSQTDRPLVIGRLTVLR